MAFKPNEIELYIEKRFKERVSLYYEQKYGTNWKHKWIYKEIREDFDNSPKRYELIENVFGFEDPNAVEAYILSKYVDVEIISIEKKINQPFPSAPARIYYEVYFTIGKNSPYYQQGNIISFVYEARSEESVRRALEEEDYFRIITLKYLGRTSNVFNPFNEYLVVGEYLKNHPRFEPKWQVKFPNRWPIDSYIPKLADREWKLFNDDQDLENWLNENLPNEDMIKTLGYLGKNLGSQLEDIKQPTSYSLMPLYVGNENGKLKISRRDPHEVPRVVPTDDAFGFELQYKRLYPTIIADLPYLFRNLVLEDQIDSWGDVKFERKSRRAYLNELNDAFLLWKGIYCVDKDENDFFDDEQREGENSIYKYVPPHKFMYVLHSYSENLSPSYHNDNGNTYEVIKYPKTTLATVKIDAVTDLGTIIYASVSPSDFQISDSILKIDNRLSELQTEQMKKGYGRGHKGLGALLWQDEYTYVILTKKSFNTLGVGHIEGDFSNLDITVGDNVNIFAGYSETTRACRVKKLKLSENVSNLPINTALLYGDNILPIKQYENNEIWVIDEGNALDDTAIGAEVDISTYWTSLVSGELINNDLIGKKIKYSSSAAPPTLWDGVDTVVNNVELWPEHVARDIATMCQDVFHEFLLTFGLDIDINIDDASVVGNFDADWGVLDTSITVNKIKIF